MKRLTTLYMACSQDMGTDAFTFIEVTACASGCDFISLQQTVSLMIRSKFFMGEIMLRQFFCTDSCCE